MAFSFILSLALTLSTDEKNGKNNPKEAEIIADNQARTEWNQTVDIALVEGVSEVKINKVKKEEISNKVSQSIAVHGRKPDLFSEIIRRAKVVLSILIQKQKMPPKPKLTIDVSEFRKMQVIKKDLEAQVQKINFLENRELPELMEQSEGLKGIFKVKEKKR